MYDEEEYPVIYDGDELHLVIPQICRNEIEGGKFSKCVPVEEWDYGFDHEIINIVSKIMSLIENNKEYINTLIGLCDK